LISVIPLIQTNGVGVGVGVSVFVTVGVGVFVGVCVLVTDGVGVKVLVGVIVGVIVGVVVGVEVGVGDAGAGPQVESLTHEDPQVVVTPIGGVIFGPAIPYLK